MSDHPELENAVAAYVLGAADPEEMESVRTHLAGCDSCRAVAARLQRAVDELPLAVELGAPPARLKTSLLAAVVASPRRQAPPPAAALPVRRPKPPRHGPAFGWLRLRPATVAIAALAVLVVGLGGWNLWLAGQLSQSRHQVAQETLTGTGPMSSAQAKVVDLRDQGVALVSFSHLPPLASGRVYELWLIPPGGAPEAAAVFQPDSDGGKTLVVGKDLRRYKLIAVTVEAGPEGAPAPTQTPSLAGATV